MLNVFCKKLIINDFHITDWVHVSFVVYHFFILKGSNDVEDSVDSLDVWQESIAQTFSLASSLDKSSNVPDWNTSCHFTFWIELFAKPFESLIRHVNFRFFWLDCAEGVVLCRYTQVREHVKGWRFADIWKTYETHFQRVWGSSEDYLFLDFDLLLWRHF